MTTIERLSETELHERRAELLRRSGMSELELRAQAAHFALTVEQADLLSEVDGLDYLLGE